MELYVNNEKKQVPEGATVSTLLEKMNIRDNTGLAVAVNQQVISRQKWEEALLNENDQVLLIKISQGG